MRLEAGAGAGCDIPAITSEAVVRLPGRFGPGVILTCDHAENTLPAEYGSLGLPPAEFGRHIAYDIGARGVTERLAALLGAPAVLTRFSRLLIDCNRGEDDPTLIMRLSDGSIVPGNRHLTAQEREMRLARYYRPYHAAIAGLIDTAGASGFVPAILALHSFTPLWRGVPRPWHAAVLWDKDPRLAQPLLAGLRAERDFVVGDNEPYAGSLEGDALWRHGTSRGLPHALVEIRQDLIASESGQAEWAERLARILRGLLAGAGADPDLKSIKFYGSHSDSHSDCHTD